MYGERLKKVESPVERPGSLLESGDLGEWDKNAAEYVGWQQRRAENTGEGGRTPQVVTGNEGPDYDYLAGLEAGDLPRWSTYY
jgi:hypothetical protein